eukprot:135312-Rhodomonas_salina.3
MLLSYCAHYGHATPDALTESGSASARSRSPTAVPQLQAGESLHRRPVSPRLISRLRGSGAGWPRSRAARVQRESAGETRSVDSSGSH